MTIGKRKLRFLIVTFAILLLGVMLYIILYQDKVKITNKYTAFSYGEGYENTKTVALNMTLTKRLFYDDLLDGSIVIDGESYEISNHRAFFIGEDTSNMYYVPMRRSLITRIKDRIVKSPYKMERLVINHTDGSNLRKTEITLTLSRDFKYLFGIVDRGDQRYQFAAPANNMDEVREISKILFKEE
ncbi:hypothetical protein PASE110613_14610 [Paenibacillus sediminis]|uniref:Uncharacterized protein n=1 Tax=Paenibacillus sediminis TaxID=664909 RepID=A0ABS4H7Z0_9BACL|nr:hypothetical protein [Paenibacillus sediminis]MBP1938648.1 hypothetical protein [Paenibacillus sediminis]